MTKENIPKISVIIPVFNSESFLKKCLDSIKNQTFENFEVIIVNDGSTDDSEIICQDFVKEDERFNYFKQKNKGKSTAVNFGFKKAKGDYIYFLDSDDYIDKDLLSIAHETASKYHVDIVNFNYYYLKDKQQFKGFTKFPKNKVLENYDIKSFISEWSPDKNSLLWFTWINLIKKSLLDDFNIIHNEKLKRGVDSTFNLECYINAKGLYSLDHHLYYYVYNPNSLTQLKYKPNFLRDLENQFFERIEIQKKYGIHNRNFINAMVNYYVSHSPFALINNEKNHTEGLKIKSLKKIRASEIFKYCFKHYNGITNEILKKKIIITLFKYNQLWLIWLLNGFAIKLKFDRNG
ncbi:glycosyltransferase family 2 protein [Gaetbulibacter sp. M240]|uniref:glycosyltransferase family 2 protein n=1 Tax=Gaetbulibacter sp. M240 TaxID=3126511 RepID=UPI00374ECDD6